MWIITCLLALLAVSQVNSLRCWRCSSDVSNGEFCKDPFNESLINEKYRQWSYVDCQLPSDVIPALKERAYPVCKKIIQEVGAKIVFARACSYELRGDAPDNCKYVDTPPNIKTIYCETCTTDGCNGDNSKALNDPSKTTAAPNDNSSAVSNNINRLALISAALLAILCRL